MDLLVITMVWGAPACRGARKGAFSIFYKKFIKLHKNHEISKKHEILWNFMTFMKFMEIIGFCESGASKTLIFLRKYWCFCNATNFMKFLFSTEKVEISWFPNIFAFSKNFKENALFLKKRAHGAQDPPKCIVFHWFKQHSRQPATPVRKHDFSEKSKKLFPRFTWKWKFHENDGNFKNSMISRFRTLWIFRIWKFQGFLDFKIQYCKFSGLRGTLEVEHVEFPMLITAHFETCNTLQHKRFCPPP